jgi:anthranilate phosphoribosyltransferase
VVLLNAGASLFVGGAASSVREGIVQAARAIDTGAARVKLDAMIEASSAQHSSGRTTQAAAPGRSASEARGGAA